MVNALRVSVFGAGYVGLVTAAGLAAIGHHVLCVDVDERKIASLTSGEVPFFEPGLPEMIARGVASQHLRFTSSVNLAIDHGQVIIIGVGTPPLSSGAADLSQVLSVEPVSWIQYASTSSSTAFKHRSRILDSLRTMRIKTNFIASLF